MALCICVLSTRRFRQTNFIYNAHTWLCLVYGHVCAKPVCAYMIWRSHAHRPSHSINIPKCLQPYLPLVLGRLQKFHTMHNIPQMVQPCKLCTCVLSSYMWCVLSIVLVYVVSECSFYVDNCFSLSSRSCRKKTI